MKIKTSELKQLLREALKEELTARALKEDAAEEAEVTVDDILADADGYEIEYEGWENDISTDHFDSFSGHYQTPKFEYYDDFTYYVEPVDLFEYLVDLLQEKAKEANTSELMTEYKKLMDAWYKAEGDEEDRACAAMELWVAQHLHELADMFSKDITDHFWEEAYDWAERNLRPIDPLDYRDWD